MFRALFWILILSELNRQEMVYKTATQLIWLSTQRKGLKE